MGSAEEGRDDTSSQQTGGEKMRKISLGHRSIGFILSAAIIIMALLPAVHATFSASASPNSGKIDFFPAIPEYDNFASNLTVTGSVSGTPTWTYAPASGSPTCANYIHVTFGNANAWNTTATFDDHSSLSCNANIVLTVSSSGGSAQTTVHVSYFFCRNCL